MRPEGSGGLRSRSWSVAGEREGWSAASERTLRHGDDVAWCDREVGRQVTIVDDLVQADGVAGGSAVAPAIQAGAVRRRELVDATRGQYRVEPGHALPVRDRDRLAPGPGHPDPRQVPVAARPAEPRVGKKC